MPYCSRYACASDEQGLFRDPVGRVRLLGVAVQRSSSRNGTGVNFGYAQMVPSVTTVPDSRTRACSSTCAPIIEVRVPEAAGPRPVRADPADFGREVEDELRRRLVKEAGGVASAGQVVIPAPDDERLDLPSARSRSTR